MPDYISVSPQARDQFAQLDAMVAGIRQVFRSATTPTMIARAKADLARVDAMLPALMSELRGEVQWVD